VTVAGTSHGDAMAPASAPGRVPPGDSGQLLTIAQAADYLCTGQRFVRRLISERRIPHVKLGKHVRLERCALDAFIAAGRVPCR
jgi:excisionase family DNA binding protein